MTASTIAPLYRRSPTFTFSIHSSLISAIIILVFDSKQNSSMNLKIKVSPKFAMPVCADIPIYITANMVPYIRYIMAFIRETVSLTRPIKAVIRDLNSPIILMIPPVNVARVVRKEFAEFMRFPKMPVNPLIPAAKGAVVPFVLSCTICCMQNWKFSFIS